jgi:hypothetical protein
MEAGPMRDLLLQCSGVAAIAAALIHGILGETKVMPRVTIKPARLRTLIRLVWQAGTVAWIGGGVLLIAAPWDGIGAGAALDRRDHGLRVRIRRVGQRPRHPRPALRLDGARRRGRAGDRGVLKHDPEKWEPVFRKDHAQPKRRYRSPLIQRNTLECL